MLKKDQCGLFAHPGPFRRVLFLICVSRKCSSTDGASRIQEVVKIKALIVHFGGYFCLDAALDREER